MLRFLISIVGPTAVGKTAVAIAVAEKFKTQVLSADSRQFYKELNIGTAKPSEQELRQIKHHFINHLSINNQYSAGEFETEALHVLDKLFKTHEVVVMAGGSGLFVNAVLEGFDEMPEVDPGLREKLNEKLLAEGLEPLLKIIEEKDPDYFFSVDKSNPQRVVRAVEVILSTGNPYSQYRKKQVKKRPFEIIKIGLNLPREQLYQRIDQRMDNMIAQGLFQEAEEFFPLRHLNALQTVGYTEIFDYLEGIYDKEEAIRLLKRNSRRYAKRQLTWFNRDSEVAWFEPERLTEIIDYIDSRIVSKKKEA